MGKRIFVRNLSFASTDEGLRAHFEQAGHEVRSARIVLDRETGKSRGFGFVELVDDSQVEAAIGALDGSYMDGRPISVREAHDQRPGGGGGGALRGPRESSYEGGGGGYRARPPREGAGPSRPEGDFRPRPPREGGYGGGGGGAPGGGFPPPAGDFAGERRRPSKKKNKRAFRGDDDDRGGFRDSEDRKSRRQRKHVRGGFDGDFDEDW